MSYATLHLLNTRTPPPHHPLGQTYDEYFTKHDTDVDGTDIAHEKSVSLAEFRKLMTDNFNLPQSTPSTNLTPPPFMSHTCTPTAHLLVTTWVHATALLPVVNRVFHVFDEDNSGSVSWRELFKGLTQVLTGTVEDRAAMYFRIYDTDASGELSTDEVLHMVLSSQEAVEDSAVEVKKILDKLDEVSRQYSSTGAQCTATS